MPTLKIPNGISGSATVRSITRKESSKTPEATNSRIVRAVNQPTSGASEIAYTSSVKPAVTEIAPSGS